MNLDWWGLLARPAILLIVFFFLMHDMSKPSKKGHKPAKEDD